MDLYSRSVEVILENQHPSGAYVACPNFSNYRYCWLRDGSFIAHAMGLAGECSSAEKFFRWVHQVITRYSGKVDFLEEKYSLGEKARPNEYLHTRFTLEGFEDSKDEGWGNFQMDGYGTWLWALAEHIQLTGDTRLLAEFSSSIFTTLKYLRLAWDQPNYDCWEESPEFIHPYSLAAVYAGFSSMEKCHLQVSGLDEQFPVSNDAIQIKQFILNYGVKDEMLVKHVRPVEAGREPSPVKESGVDASLIGVIHPYKVFASDDPVAINTITRIEQTLYRENGGVYRYARDEYYGGGVWILLTAWLGWYYNMNDQKEKAAHIAEWIEKQADASGNLPEQVADHTLFPQHYPVWRDKWGEIASPLLWSHAMYIILKKTL